MNKSKESLPTEAQAEVLKEELEELGKNVDALQNLRDALGAVEKLGPEAVKKLLEEAFSSPLP